MHRDSGTGPSRWKKKVGCNAAVWMPDTRERFHRQMENDVYRYLYVHSCTVGCAAGNIVLIVCAMK